ncbi:MAG: hypothetical protein ACI88A_004242 [Paraglaciecola sp.]|jgi:hypothetical protein
MVIRKHNQLVHIIRCLNRRGLYLCCSRKERYMSQNDSTQTPNNLAAFCWPIADLLRGDFKQSQYGRIVLPFTLLRRLQGFSKDAREIFEYFNFAEFIGQLSDANLLYKVVKKVFSSEINLSPKTANNPNVISNHDMGLTLY